MQVSRSLAFALIAGFLLALCHLGVALDGRSGTVKVVFYLLPEVVAAGIVFVRATRRSTDRRGWLLIAAALAAYAAGDGWWSATFSLVGTPASLGVDDVFYVSGHLLLLAGLLTVARGRRVVGGGVPWLDGLIGGLVAAALVGAVLLETVGDPGPSASETIETIGYAGLALLVLSTVMIKFSVAGWHPGSQLAVLGVGVCCIAIAWLFYTAALADGGYVFLGVGDTLWPFGFMLCALAACMPTWPQRVIDGPHWRDGVVPGACAFVAVSVLAAAALTESVGLTATLLAAAAALLGGLRAAIIFVDHVRLVESSRTEAREDELSALPNRRALIEDLDKACAAAATSTLALFDLDGFKLYNDRFGHPAGDALLRRLADRLSGQLVGGVGRAYRLGGDEFCVLVAGDGDVVTGLLGAARDALRERGNGFNVTASYGAVAIPAEAESPAQALRLVDQRMYARKAERQEPVLRQARDLLLAVVRETEPELDEHNADVGRNASVLATRLGVVDDDLDVIVRGAELHDVGKVAIPDDILHKPSALSEDEWQLMRQHTIVGERILAASPGLGPVGHLVRASHERWDGNGYPDGLCGEAIPLGARIISVCDTFDAIVSDRPYAAGRSITEALTELRRCAGSQFDPVVVEVFNEIVSSGALSGADTPGTLP